MARSKYVQIENKNAILELLAEGRPIEKIFIANNAFKDPKTKQIVDIAHKQGIPLEKIARRAISRRSKTSSKESVIGFMPVDNQYSLDTLIEKTYSEGKEPFYLIFNDIKYAMNIGAIFRTAFAAGVNGIITPVQKGNLLSDEVVRISMGTCLRIPIAEVNIFAAIKDLQKNGVDVVALDMEGVSCYESKLTGPVAFMLGSEAAGVSSKVGERVNRTISIPMREGLGSLNVSVATAVVCYEKCRQEIKLNPAYLNASAI